LGAAGFASGALAAASGAGADASEAGAADASPAFDVSTLNRTAPTYTSSPSANRTSVISPACVVRISCPILSLSIATIGSSSATMSPFYFSHVAT